jgi:hypothetical protein
MKSSASMQNALVTRRDLSLQSLTSASLQEKLGSVNTLTEINLVSNNIEDASCLSRYPMLRKVSLMRNPLKDIKWVEQLPQLEELEISETDVSDLTPLKHLPNLRKFSASSTKIKDIRPIAHCKQLEILYLSDNDLLDDLSALRNLDKLNELHICAVNNLTAQTLLSLASLPSLTVLDVDDEYRSTKNYIMMMTRESRQKQQHKSPLFKGNHPITDRELLTACRLTMEISVYYLAPEIPGVLSPLLLKYDARQSPQLTASLSEEKPDSLQLLEKQGWQIVNASHWMGIGDISAYQGVILINHSRKAVLLAHRGVQFIGTSLFADLHIDSQSHVPKIINDAIAMGENATQLANHSSYELFHTGFLTGGFLAQITASV